MLRTWHCFRKRNSQLSSFTSPSDWYLYDCLFWNAHQAIASWRWMEQASLGKHTVKLYVWSRTGEMWSKFYLSVVGQFVYFYYFKSLSFPPQWGLSGTLCDAKRWGYTATGKFLLKTSWLYYHRSAHSSTASFRRDFKVEREQSWDVSQPSSLSRALNQARTASLCSKFAAEMASMQ